ncbi:polymorphic toxin type 15 domain-containing protein, partial [Pseudomonas syringae]
NTKIATVKTALEVGGDENAEALGKAIGEIAWQVGSIATGVGGAAKGGVALAKVGIKVGSAELEKMAVDGVKLVKTEASNAGKTSAQRSMADAPETTIKRSSEELAGDNKPTTDAPIKNEKPDTSPYPDKAVPVMDEFTVKAFNPFNSDKFKAMTPEQQKSFLKEYNKQLQAQQNAINSMKVEDFKAARDAYDSLGRNPDAVAAQQKFGKDFENEVRDSITESLMTKGADFKTASAEAAGRAKEIRSKLAALHDPDMVAGGWFSHEPVRMGDTLINSSIGGSWPSRLKALDEAVSSAIANGSGQANMNVRLELLRGRGN